MKKVLLVSFILLSACLVNGVFAQSTDQTNPTPITAGQIAGEIRARDIGDSRLTTFYYLFGGDRGDVFVNVVTSNINGTIDIFTVNGLQPRTRITLFADNPESETGRVVYMREAEKLILRIQGRSPNDEPGKFQIKFAGSFVAADEGDIEDEGPKVSSTATGAVRVNSVGTIIESPVVKSVQPPADDNSADRDKSVATQPSTDPKATPANEKAEPKEAASAVEVLVAAVPKETIVFSPEKNITETEPAPKEVTLDITSDKPRRSAIVTISRVDTENTAAGSTDGVSDAADAKDKTEDEVNAAVRDEAPAKLSIEERLAQVQLKIVVKGGALFMRPMNEVLSMNVIKGIMTVVTTDGKIREFSILDVESVKIE